MIIKTQDTLKHYVGLNSEDDIEVMSAHIEEAQEEYITAYLGTELTEKLDGYVEAGKTPDDPKLNKLLKKTERPLSYFAYMIGTPFLDVILTQSGFAVMDSQGAGLAPASKDRVASLKNAITDLAHKSIERLLLFLEQNRADYPEWQNSDAYFEWNRYFVNTARAFHKICNIGNSRLMFLKMRQDMADMEQLHIEPAITAGLATELKQQAKDGTLTKANAIVFELVQRATAHLTYASHMEVEKHRQTGTVYLSRAVNIILQNQADYPAASALFQDNRTRREKLYRNTGDTGFYVS